MDGWEARTINCVSVTFVNLQDILIEDLSTYSVESVILQPGKRSKGRLDACSHLTVFILGNIEAHGRIDLLKTGYP